MNRSLIFGFILAASVATAAPWSKLNPFKGKKAANTAATAPQTAKSTKKAKPVAVASAVPVTPAAQAVSQKEKKAKEQKPKDYTGIYTTGTVAAIPDHTAGRLDFNDTEVLKFHYGKPTWAVAYNKVKTIEVADKKEDPLVRIPGLNPRRRVFTIEYTGSKDDVQFITFEIPVKDSFEVLPLLEERTGKGVAVAGAKTPGVWWGDAIWRTSRNAALWDEANPQQKTAIAQKD